MVVVFIWGIEYYIYVFGGKGGVLGNVVFEVWC